ncbi:hypothetical protein HOK51_07135 [Candidatus Woesearchaeota archaeon]|nr:hypothetical protein [Candidatus Woesearchaeota archaeon]
MWQEQDDSETGTILTRLYGTNNVIPYYDHLKQEVGKLDLLVVCEPTWANVGLKIRNKIIHEIEGKDFSAADTAEAYALDRQELLLNLVLPAIYDNVDVGSERNVCSSITYQSTMDSAILGVNQVLDYPGNVLAMKNSPDLYMICKISAATAMKRLAMREKKDEAKFEKLDFLGLLQEKYESEWLKDMLEQNGSMVAYVNTDEPKTVEDSIFQSVHILDTYKLNKI